MAHKVITIDITERRDSHGHRRRALPYSDTDVGFNQSLGQIKDMLQKFKCERVIDFSESCKGQEYTIHTVGFEKDGLRYLIEFPITYVENSKGRRLDMNVSGRIVYYRVKALLVDAEINYLTFHEAMLSYLALPTPQGPKSVMEVVQEQIEGIKKGTAGLFLLPGRSP
ncbi:MAG TPA: hypothetical protein PLO06_11255 [Methanoregulaceae archaeon]|nr:hypothetical protein [Methanoregulaceae archaeon]